MRGTKAKRLRRQAYGEGNAMPRHQHHEYKLITGTRNIGGRGTLLIISARRMYKNLKKGVPVYIGSAVAR